MVNGGTNSDVEVDGADHLSEVALLLGLVDTRFSAADIPWKVLELEVKEVNRLAFAAEKLFDSGRIADAADAYLFVVTLNPNDHPSWVQLGAAEEALGRHETALKAYGMAALLDLDDPTPHVHAAQCYMEMGDTGNAIEALRFAVTAGINGDEFSRIKERAVALTDRIEANKAKG